MKCASLFSGLSLPRVVLARDKGFHFFLILRHVTLLMKQIMKSSSFMIRLNSWDTLETDSMGGPAWSPACGPNHHQHPKTSMLRLLSPRRHRGKGACRDEHQHRFGIVFPFAVNYPFVSGIGACRSWFLYLMLSSILRWSMLRNNPYGACRRELSEHNDEHHNQGLGNVEDSRKL